MTKEKLMRFHVPFMMMVLVSAGIQAQTTEKLNCYGSLGYGFGTGGQLFSSTQLSAGVNGRDSIDRKDRYFNYGRGLKVDLGVQYFMMENVALQAGFYYSGGVPALEASYRVDTASATIFDSTFSFHHHLFGLKVCAVPRFEILELLNVNAGVGIGLFWNSLRYEIVSETPTATRNEEGAIQSSPTLGLVGLVGADFPLTDLMSLYSEVGFEQMSFKWKKRIIDQSQFGRRTGSYNFEKNTPNQEPPPRIPGSNWRIGVGIRYVLM
jgi:opacity protein-like surface antigen